MKDEITFCAWKKADVVKSEHCPSYECNSCTQRLLFSQTAIQKKRHTGKKPIKKKPKKVTERNDYFLTVYTLHPQKTEYSPEELPDKEALNDIPAHIAESPQNLGKAYIPLVCAKGAFKRSQNPVYAIQAFLLAHEAGVYPPLWVLNYMHKVFKKYYKTNGRESLDALFGFSRGKGQEPAFKSVFSNDRDEMLMRDVFRLNLLGYSIRQASYMVSRRLEEAKGWDKTGLNLNELTEDTINDRYLKKWRAVFNNEVTRKHTLEWLNKNKNSFLGKFPKDCFYSGAK